MEVATFIRGIDPSFDCLATRFQQEVSRISNSGRDNGSFLGNRWQSSSSSHHWYIDETHGFETRSIVEDRSSHWAIEESVEPLRREREREKERWSFSVCLFVYFNSRWLSAFLFALRWEEMRVFFYLNSALFLPRPLSEQWMMSVQIFRRHSTEISSRGQTEEPNDVVHVRLTYLLLLFFFPLMILVVLFVVVLLFLWRLRGSSPFQNVSMNETTKTFPSLDVNLCALFFFCLCICICLRTGHSMVI